MSPFPQEYEMLSTFYGVFPSVPSRILDSCKDLTEYLYYIVYTLKKKERKKKETGQGWSWKTEFLINMCKNLGSIFYTESHAPS